MKLCETCKYWNFERGEYQEVKGLGKCERIVEIWEATEWSDECIRIELDPTCMAYAYDGSSYAAGLLTKPSFGCVMHEPKDTDQ